MNTPAIAPLPVMVGEVKVLFVSVDVEVRVGIDDDQLKLPSPSDIKTLPTEPLPEILSSSAPIVLSSIVAIVILPSKYETRSEIL